MVRETRSGVLIPSDARLSRIAIARSVDVELTTIAALHICNTPYQERQEPNPHLAVSRIVIRRWLRLAAGPTRYVAPDYGVTLSD